MQRDGSILRGLILLIGVVALVEWTHVRLGQPTIFSAIVSSGPNGSESARQPGFGPVAESEFEVWVGVLERMHSNRGLTVEEAARAEGLELDEFREIEIRVQRDPLLVERARDALRENAVDVWELRSEAATPGA